MGKKKRGVTAKKARALTLVEPEEVIKAPHSFVIHHGKVGRVIRLLEKDVRQIMEPYTAANLKVGKRNVLEDFVNMSGKLNVSHMLVFTRTELSPYLHIVRVPKGPSLTFKIKDFTLAKDVISSLKKPSTGLYRNFPLVVLNNFSSDRVDVQLMSTMFQHMFPSINVHKVNLNDIRRCVLFNYNDEDKTVDLRHYAIKVVPYGLSKVVKKLMQNKVPDLGRYEDISEYVLKGGMLSDSEVEPDGPHNSVVLPQDIRSRGNLVNQKSAIRLVELGPRLTLQLVKIQEHVLTGQVLFHDHVHKSMEEVLRTQERQERKATLKRQAQKKTEEAKARKLQEREEHNKIPDRGMKVSKENGKGRRSEEEEPSSKKRKKEMTPIDKLMVQRAKRKKIKDKAKTLRIKKRRYEANAVHSKVAVGKLAAKKKLLKKRRK